MFDSIGFQVDRRFVLAATVLAGFLVLAVWGSGLFGLPKGLSIDTLDPSSTVNAADGGPVEIGQSGLPLPRFVSLKSGRVNVRVGPSQDHAISWVFKRQGLPVEIVAESGNWRQIRDSEGAEGWVIQSLLSGRRTALIAPWSGDDESAIPLRGAPANDATVTALLERKVLASLLECRNQWCLIHVQEFEGWLPQDLLWGIGPNETL